MALTTSVSVAPHIMSEILATMSLGPLRSKYVMLPLLNSSSIDGKAGEDREIPKRTAIAEAVDDTEGVEFTDYEELTFDASVTLTPTGKIQGIAPSVKALRRAMPGKSYEEVVAALKSGNADGIPIYRVMVEEILHSHYRAAERAALALLAGASDSAGVTNTALSFAHVLDARTQLLDNNPEHTVLACVLSEKGIGDLQSELIAGTGVSLAALWANGAGDAFLNAIGDAAPSQAPKGNILGMPVYGADVSLMTTANADVDSVGGVFCVGRGETAVPGSLRGFAEFCEGHGLSLGVAYDLESDTAPSIGRYEWDVEEHTDEHVIKLIFKKT